MSIPTENTSEIPSTSGIATLSDTNIGSKSDSDGESIPISELAMKTDSDGDESSVQFGDIKVMIESDSDEESISDPGLGAIGIDHYWGGDFGEFADTQVGYQGLVESDSESDADVDTEDGLVQEGAKKVDESYWDQGYTRGFGHGKPK